MKNFCCIQGCIAVIFREIRYNKSERKWRRFQILIHPEGYIEMIKDKSYENLLKERNALMKQIREFEESMGKPKDDRWKISPSPEVVYQCNLMYLAKLCELIKETYNRVYVWGDEV